MSDASPSFRRPGIPGLKDSQPGAAYKKGDFIGQKYEVYGILGKGGFGIVYLVYSHETEYVFALKTFQMTETWGRYPVYRLQIGV